MASEVWRRRGPSAEQGGCGSRCPIHEAPPPRRPDGAPTCSVDSLGRSGQIYLPVAGPTREELSADAELLIRAFDGRLARDGQPWITHRPNGTAALDVDALGALSAGERRVLRVVIALILAALAHAGGSHEHALLKTDPATGRAQLSRAGPLDPWPDEPPQQDLAVSRRYWPAPTTPREAPAL